MFKDSNPHVTQMVAFFIEVCTSGFVKMFVPYIALMFSKPIFKSSICFSNILNVALGTSNEIDDVTAVAIYFMCYLMMVV